jgi:hypothetical protein
MSPADDIKVKVTVESIELHSVVPLPAVPGEHPRKLVVSHGPSGFEVYQSAEFKALMDKFFPGIWENQTKDLRLDLTENFSRVVVVANDKEALRTEVVDSTCFHNKVFRTHLPPTHHRHPAFMSKDERKVMAEDRFREFFGTPATDPSSVVVIDTDQP